MKWYVIYVRGGKEEEVRKEFLEKILDESYVMRYSIEVIKEGSLIWKPIYIYICSRFFKQIHL